MVTSPLEFDLEPTTGEFEAFPVLRSEQYSEEMQEYLASIHSIRTGTPIEMARAEISTLGEEMFVGRSRADATALVEDEAKRDTEAAIEVSSLPDIVKAEEKRSVNQEVVTNAKAPEIIAETQSNPGDIWDRVTSISAARTSTLHKKLAEVSGETNLTLLSGILDFADIILSYPFDVLTGGGFHRADLAQEIQNLISADISETEFNDRLDEVLEEAKDAGWFSGENALFLFGQIENIRQGGRGSEATLDKFATVLDAVAIPSLIGLGSKLALRGFSAARNTTSIVGTLRGPAAAGDNLVSALNNPSTAQAAAAGIPEHTLPGYLRHPTSGVDNQAWSAPGFDKAAKHESQNTFLNIIRNYGFSQRINPETFDKWVPKGLKILNDEVEATSRSNMLSLRVDPDDSGNVFGSILFGRRDGTPFTTKGNATKFANRNGGEVVPITQGNKTSYMVEQTKNLSTSGLVDPLNSWEIGTHFFRAWGSTFLSVPRRLEALAKRGEGVLGRLSQDIAPVLDKAIKATGKEERRVVEQVFTALRDGDELSKSRRALTIPEFRTEFARLNNQVGPTKAAEELYVTIQELNDALYFLKADVKFKEVVDQGGEVFKLRGVDADGVATERNIIVARAGDDLDPTTVVYNPVSGEQKLASDLKPNEKIFKVPGGFKVGEEVATHITSDSPELRRVSHSDVLGYNPGGPRSYKFLNFAVGQRRTVNILGKGPTRGREKIIMGTATRKEAQTTVEQINNILSKVREMVPNIAGMTQANALDALRAIGNDPDLLEVVLRNNDWNDDIESVGDFIKLVEDYRLDIRENMGFKHMDDAFGVADDTGQMVFGGSPGETQRDAFEGILNSPRNGPRGNDPLVGFGGNQAQTRSPMDTISKDFIRVTHERAFSAYNFQAVNGWLKGAANHITAEGKKAMAGLPPRQAMNSAIFAENPDIKARGFMAARDSINRTLGHQSKYEKDWNGFVDRLAERIYDKGFQKLGMTVGDAQLSKNPLTALRGFAFHAKLGMLAIDQLFVQASQTFNILAIAGPVRTIPAMAAYWPLRMTMVNKSPEFAKELGRRVAAFTGMDADEFVEFSRFWNESGRGIIGGEIGELNAVSHTMAKGYRKRLGEVSRTFFDEGERVPRGVAMHVSWQEYRKAFPKMDPFSDHGVNWITNRQDTLNAAMTRVSAAPWQKGPLSIPFQFMSYTSKMMESIFSNRLLTRNERIRLAGAQVAFWGASGTVFGGPLLDYFVTEGGLELTGGEYTALRYGALDWAIGATTGSDTGFGERLAVGEGMWNMWEDFHDETLFEALGGPSVQVTGDLIDGILQGLGDVARGNTSMVEADVKKFIRNFTGPNKAYNAWVLYNTGDYLSRNGSTIASGLSNTDALLHLIGAPLQEISLTYTRIDAFANQDDHLRTHGNRIAEIAREMQESVRNGDLDKAREQSKLMAMYVAALPTWQQEKLKRFYTPDASSTLRDVILEGRRRNAPNLNILDDEGE